jgi:hypothetical protein
MEAGQRYQDFSNGSGFYVSNNLQSSIQWSKQISKAVTTALSDTAAAVLTAAVHEQSQIERMAERADIASKTPSAVLIYRIPVVELESLRIFDTLNEERLSDWQQVVRYHR